MVERIAILPVSLDVASSVVSYGSCARLETKRDQVATAIRLTTLPAKETLRACIASDRQYSYRRVIEVRLHFW